MITEVPDALAGDEEWWQAQRLMGSAADLEQVGIVPSKSRYFKHARYTIITNKSIKDK